VKCDLHVHSRYSGPCDTPLLNRFFRESYSDPEELHRLLTRREMDLVTITDHDSIEGALVIRNHRNVFLSEEVTCRMPSGTTIHIGAYDLTERQHVQIQQRRNDLISLLMYLTERRIFFSVNHVFSGLTGPRAREDFDWLQYYFPAVETRNGQMLAGVNARAERLAKRWQKTGIAGSDAHTRASAGTTYTEVPGATNRQEFLEGLRAGHGRVCGDMGGYVKLTRDLLLIVGEAVKEKPWMAAFGLIILGVPAAVLFHNASEFLFARLWAARVLGRPEGPRRAAFPSAESALVPGGNG
jgi:predicted metal-dependent phosphoesterase TrpH